MERQRLGKDFAIELNKEVLVEELELKLVDIIVEEIIGDSPGDDANYPSGSGVTAILELKHGEESTKITLTQLSEGYTSDLEGTWKGYKVILLAGDLEKIILKVEKVQEN